MLCEEEVPITGFGLAYFTRRLSAGERLGELLFGLITTLTFTLTAGFIVGEYKEAVRQFLIATVGCNVAWGIIDGGLLVLGRVFDRGRSARVGRAIRSSGGTEDAVHAVATELDDILVPVTIPEGRCALYLEIVRRTWAARPRRTGVRGDDWLAAFAVFCLVVFASSPAALPFALIAEPWIALCVSNAVLLALFFVIGYLWAGYTTIKPWRAATVLTLSGVFMVATAITLGG